MTSGSLKETNQLMNYIVLKKSGMQHKETQQYNQQKLTYPMKRNNNIRSHWKLVSLVKHLQCIKTGVPDFIGKKKYYSTGSIKADNITSEGEYEFKNKPSRANRKAKLGDVFQAR